jgi:hypothetical protein
MQGIHFQQNLLQFQGVYLQQYLASLLLEYPNPQTEQLDIVPNYQASPLRRVNVHNYYGKDESADL